ncbi:hypothetical protein [Dysgonomonas sp. 25]|uniref:hypothetical protein n=1 Tax=Dysgonomonas sp. 25 TaxID=2302933 RepID=UPI0013D48C11|nr:hypothetical protein [Dysgonomonas sp. 25]NDV67602.1 hypothetical protein [Dysgonomonas sp. 25]
MKYHIISIIAALFLLSSCSILNKEKSSEEVTTYKINSYIINPSEKKIYVEGMIGGKRKNEDGSVTHWDGIQVVQDRSINYKKTKLIVFGRYIKFKEYFNLLDSLSDARFIYGTSYFTDGKKVYGERYGELEEMIDISEYKRINDFLYQKNGELYAYNPDSYATQMDSVIGLEYFDTSSVKHIDRHYFTTKDGLYWLGSHLDSKDRTMFWSYDSRLLEKNEDGNGEAITYSNYFTYNNSVYAYNSSEIKRLDLDASKTKKIILEPNRPSNWISALLTDGNNTYECSETSEFYLIDTARVKLPANITGWIPIIYRSGYYKKGKDLYIDACASASVDGSIVWTPDGFYNVIKDGRYAKYLMIPVGNIWIKNYATGEYEIIDHTQYKLYKSNFYTYKGLLYINNRPVVNDIDVDKLTYFSYNGKKSAFLTDGKHLLYADGNFGYSEENNTQKLTLPLPDFKTLSVIEYNILIDKNYIYNGRNNTVIPRKKLGFEVVVYK